MSIEKTLTQGLQALGLHLSIEPFLDYLHLLHKWNKAYNLTAVRNLNDMVSRHILDSLAILPWVQGKHILDVGTGAGLPGIPLAIARPELNIVLLDSNGKKIRFLHEVKRKLNLNQIEIVQSRAESYHPSQGFDTVISRAFSDLEQMIHWTSHLVTPSGIWLAMKGQRPESELSAINYRYQIKDYMVPGLVGQRCCVIIDHANKE